MAMMYSGFPELEIATMHPNSTWQYSYFVNMLQTNLEEDQNIKHILYYYIDDINYEISKILKEQGVTKYLYENEEYIDEIREGRIVCEGIDVESIKKMIF